MEQILPIISRAAHRARLESGEQAPGLYAIIGPRPSSILEHLTHCYELRDEHDRYVTSGSASGPTMAALKAKNLGATFIVDEI